MKKILITGGAGYIGSMLATELVKLGYEVTVLDLMKFNRNSLDHLFFYDNFRFVYGDATDSNIIKKIIKNKDFIIPLAALVGAPLCKKYPKKTIQTNLNSIKILLKHRSKKNKIIYLTTNSGYGIGEKNKYCDENSPLRPISLYGRTKCDAEDEVRKKDNYICYRLATVFGFSYRMRSDLLVNNFVYTALKTKQLKIFEPKFRRNFIHIRDVIQAIIFSIKSFKKLQNNVYNLGLSTANITKLMLAKKIKQQLPATQIKIMHNKFDPDKRDYFVSNRKIEKKGFKAKINLEKGIKEMVLFFKNNKNKIINNY